MPNDITGSDAVSQLDAEAEVLTGGVVGRRVVWATADQVLFSLTSFVMAIAVGKTSTVDGFGAFALMYLAYVLTLGATEAFVAEVLTLEMPSTSRREQAELLSGALGTTLLIGVAIGVVGVGIVGSVGGGYLRLAAAVLLPAPLLFAQDVQRFARFSTDRPELAFLNDALWAVFEVAGFVFLWHTGHATPANVVLAWSVPGALCGLVAIAQERVLPSIPRAWPWVKGHWQSSVRFAGEFAALYGASQAVLAIVAITAGLHDTAGYRGGQLLYGPLIVLMSALRLAVTPLLVREYRRAGPSRVGSFAVGVAAVGALMATAWAGVLLLIPFKVGHALLGASWRETRPVLAPLGLNTAANGVALGSLALLRTLGAINRSAVTRIGTGIVILAAGTVGAIVGGASSAALCVGCSSTLGAIALWIQSGRALRDAVAVAQ